MATNERTFLELLAADEVGVEEIDVWMDRWYNDEWPMQEIYEPIGLTRGEWQQYLGPQGGEQYLLDLASTRMVEVD